MEKFPRGWRAGRLPRLLVAALFIPLASVAQPVNVDRDGVMRWSTTGEEVALFGVNYTTPFAFAYRAHNRLDISHEEAIDADVAHMARLRFDAYRIHVWDREVSDSTGNLLENEHLRLLDYLIARLKERDIKILLTPVAWWGSGWPEPDSPTPGFSTRFSKSELVSQPEAVEAQLNYFRQFMEHVNPETGLAYKDDPSIIAIELVNEPSHPEPPESTTAYINRLVEAVRSTGFDKPIFYNVSQNWSETHAKAVAVADVQGVSFQWYPAGLVRRIGLDANYLPHVDRYPLPAPDGFDHLARMVYEFDAADIPGSYIYPAMARAFREAGMQWATQFAYDPMVIAYSNTEYGTHYVNLLYTPKKAISLMIAGEVFRRLPRNRSYGSYPQNTSFGPFRVSYEHDLSEMVTSDRFYYSNTTSTNPKAESLEHVAGVGSSPVVTYGGTGAYFLDKEEDGVWRLEIYPDAVWLEDPFGPVSLSQEVSRLIRRRHPMEVRLPGLGQSFQIRPLNEGNTYRTSATDSRFEIEPGIYLLSERDIDRPSERFYVPERMPRSPAVHHEPPPVLSPGARLRFTVATDQPPRGVSLFMRRPGWSRFWRVPATEISPFVYEAVAPDIQPGPVEYFLTIDDSRTFPGSLSGAPNDWDFTGRNAWTSTVATAGAPLVLFDAARDRERLLLPHQWGYVRYSTDIVPGSEPLSTAFRARVESLDAGPRHFALQAELIDPIAAGSLDGIVALEVRIRATETATDRATVGLITADGAAWTKTVPLTQSWAAVRIPLTDLERSPRALLPRPYPIFLPYWFEPDTVEPFSLDEVQILEIALDGKILPLDQPHGFEVERVMLVRE